MDLGIAGRTAIVCGGSAGLGRGAATALARDGVVTFIAARDKDRLENAAALRSPRTPAERFIRWWPM
jgi:3-oxoacyl-[acyl-carrier protein] reductase